MILTQKAQQGFLDWMMDKEHTTQEVAVSFLGRVNRVLQMILSPPSMGMPPQLSPTEIIQMVADRDHQVRTSLDNSSMQTRKAWKAFLTFSETTIDDEMEEGEVREQGDEGETAAAMAVHQMEEELEHQNPYHQLKAQSSSILTSSFMGGESEDEEENEGPMPASMGVTPSPSDIFKKPRRVMPSKYP